MSEWMCLYLYHVSLLFFSLSLFLCYPYDETARGLWWNRFAEFMLMWVQHEESKPQLSGKQKHIDDSMKISFCYFVVSL